MKKQNTIVIGIIEKGSNRNTIKFVRDLLELFCYTIYFTNRKESIIGLNSNNINLLIFDIDSSNMDLYESLDIEFDILIHNFMKPHHYQEDTFLKQFPNCKYYIVNSDDENWMYLPLKSLKGIVINYGFNNKAALTISSYDISQEIKAGICLQRKIITMQDTRTEPFEFMVKINSNNKENIYPVLAATALTLVLNHKFDHIYL